MTFDFKNPWGGNVWGAGNHAYDRWFDGSEAATLKGNPRDSQKKSNLLTENGYKLIKEGGVYSLTINAYVCNRSSVSDKKFGQIVAGAKTIFEKMFKSENPGLVFRSKFNYEIIKTDHEKAYEITFSSDDSSFPEYYLFNLYDGSSGNTRPNPMMPMKSAHFTVGCDSNHPSRTFVHEALHVFLKHIWVGNDVDNPLYSINIAIDEKLRKFFDEKNWGAYDEYAASIEVDTIGQNIMNTGELQEERMPPLVRDYGTLIHDLQLERIIQKYNQYGN